MLVSCPWSVSLANQESTTAENQFRAFHRIRLLFAPHRVMRCALFFILAMLFSPGATAAESETDLPLYKTTLLELFDTAGEILYLIDPDSVMAIADSVEQLDQVTNEQLQTVFMDAVPLEDLQQHLQNLEPHLSAVRYLDQMDDVEIPPIDISPAVCEIASPAGAYAAQTVASVFEIIVAAQKYICLETVLGENVAIACTSFDLVRVAATSVAQEQNYCLAQQNLARNKAVLDLTRGIGEHLNTFVDEETLSSRASQAALDSAQSDFDDIQSDTQDIQAALDSGYSQLDSQSAALMAAVSDLGNDLTGLASLLNDINFRSSVNLAFLDDASLRVADLQQRASDIQIDVESILDMAVDVNTASSQLSNTLESEWTRQQRDRIAADLGNAESDSPGHALPSSAGGELELAREIVINAIFSLQALGSVDTSQALALVGKADMNYNSGNYPLAYQQFKQAYQSLDGLVEGR